MKTGSPTVAVTDWSFPNLELESEILRAAGIELRAHRSNSPAELEENVRDANAVITQFAQLTPEIIHAMRRARAIVRYGVGVDNIDLKAAAREGIPVCNVPDYCVDEVADHTLALMLSAIRQIPAHQESIRAGKWQLSAPVDRMLALRDLVVGVIGLGRIGREVVGRLRGFGCAVNVFDPAVDAGAIQSCGAGPVSFDELISTSDVISLHCPLNDSTRGLISRKTVGRMKRGAILVNVSRGPLVDTGGLVEGLESGQVSVAALDVCDPEPPPRDHPLRHLPNVILTSHVASVSPGAMKKLRETTARLAASSVKGELPPNIVNGVSVPRFGSAGSDGTAK